MNLIYKLVLVTLFVGSCNSSTTAQDQNKMRLYIGPVFVNQMAEEVKLSYVFENGERSETLTISPNAEKDLHAELYYESLSQMTFEEFLGLFKILEIKKADGSIFISKSGLLEKNFENRVIETENDTNTGKTKIAQIKYLIK